MYRSKTQLSWFRRIVLLVFFALPGAIAYAQDDELQDGEVDVEATEEDAESETETVIEEEPEDPPEIDEEYYGDVDDEDFLPSEEIPADQSIPFPTDI